MKTCDRHITNILDSSARFLGTVLAVVLMLPCITVSQLTASTTALSTGALQDGNPSERAVAVSLEAHPVASMAVVASQKFALFQNYPNPFNPSTSIQYSLKNAAHVSLKVYNLIGNEVATLVSSYQEAGSYTVSFGTNERALSSGVYFYRLTAGSFVALKRLILIK